MNQYEFFLASSLEKVFPQQRPAPLEQDVCTWVGTRAAVGLPGSILWPDQSAANLPYNRQWCAGAAGNQ